MSNCVIECNLDISCPGNCVSVDGYSSKINIYDLLNNFCGQWNETSVSLNMNGTIWDNTRSEDRAASSSIFYPLSLSAAAESLSLSWIHDFSASLRASVRLYAPTLLRVTRLSCSLSLCAAHPPCYKYIIYNLDCLKYFVEYYFKLISVIFLHLQLFYTQWTNRRFSFCFCWLN